MWCGKGAYLYAPFLAPPKHLPDDVQILVRNFHAEIFAPLREQSSFDLLDRAAPRLANYGKTVSLESISTGLVIEFVPCDRVKFFGDLARV